MAATSGRKGRTAPAKASPSAPKPRAAKPTKAKNPPSSKPAPNKRGSGRKPTPLKGRATATKATSAKPISRGRAEDAKGKSRPKPKAAAPAKAKPGSPSRPKAASRAPKPSSAKAKPSPSVKAKPVTPAKTRTASAARAKGKTASTAKAKTKPAPPAKTPAPKPEGPVKAPPPLKASAPPPAANASRAAGANAKPATKTPPPAQGSAPSRTLVPKVVPASRMGQVHADVLSALTYGLFAAINRSFGAHGRGLIQHAAQRFLEFGSAKGWIPARAEDPIEDLERFLACLQRLGYVGAVSILRDGDAVVVDVSALADFDAVTSIRSLGYPLSPILVGELVHEFLVGRHAVLVHVDDVKPDEPARGATLRFRVASQDAVVAPLGSA